MLQLLHFPDPFLRKKVDDFDFANPTMDPVKLEKEMLKIMLESKGIGLSANQVGINARVFVMGSKDYTEKGHAFFNPMIIKHTDSIDFLLEGCLSFPNIFVKVKRPSKILAKWQNTKGEWQEGELKGYDCRCFLHEFDHLEGVVFQDRVSTIRWSQALKEKNKRIKYYGRAK